MSSRNVGMLCDADDQVSPNVACVTCGSAEAVQRRRYTCPRCHATVCSALCFRTHNNQQCALACAQTSLEEELRSLKASKQTKQRTREALQRDARQALSDNVRLARFSPGFRADEGSYLTSDVTNEDADSDEEVVKRLEQLSLRKEVRFEDLPPALQQKFLRDLKRDGLHASTLTPLFWTHHVRFESIEGIQWPRRPVVLRDGYDFHVQDDRDLHASVTEGDFARTRLHLLAETRTVLADSSAPLGGALPRFLPAPDVLMDGRTPSPLLSFMLIDVAAAFCATCLLPSARTKLGVDGTLRLPSFSSFCRVSPCLRNSAPGRKWKPPSSVRLTVQACTTLILQHHRRKGRILTEDVVCRQMWPHVGALVQHKQSLCRALCTLLQLSHRNKEQQRRESQKLLHARRRLWLLLCLANAHSPADLAALVDALRLACLPMLRREAPLTSQMADTHRDSDQSAAISHGQSRGVLAHSTTEQAARNRRPLIELLD